MEIDTENNRLNRNPFAVLAKWADEKRPFLNNTAQETEQRPAPNETRKRSRPPPIIIHKMPSNVTEIIKTIKREIEEDLNTKYIGGQLKLQFNKTQKNRRFHDTATKTTLEYHAFPMEGEELTAMALKGLPPLQEEEVEKLINMIGLIPVKVPRLSKAGESPFRPVFRVTFQGTTTTLKGAREYHNVDGWIVYKGNPSPSNAGKYT